MAELDRKKTYKALKKKGFTDSESHSDDHYYLELFHNGKYVTYTKLSHSNNIHDGLIGAMARQCLLTKDQFLDLARCPLSQKKYLEILEGNGALD